MENVCLIWEIRIDMEAYDDVPYKRTPYFSPYSSHSQDLDDCLALIPPPAPLTIKSLPECLYIPVTPTLIILL